MKYLLLILPLLFSMNLMAEEIILPPLDTNDNQSTSVPVGYPGSKESDLNNLGPDRFNMDVSAPILKKKQKLRIFVIGQGVAPCDNVCSPAQAYALAKRAAITDAYRLVAEKVKGVYIEGEDYIKNMMVKRSTVRTSVNAMIRNANIVETTFKDGLCEVEMEVQISHSQF